MISPNIMCVGCPYSDGHSYSSCNNGYMNGTEDCLSRRFSNMNDRCFGEDRNRKYKEYKKNPY